MLSRNEEEPTDKEIEKGVGINARDESARKKLGFSALFATRATTKITLVMWINWIVVTLGYYGISLGIGDIGPDLFINFLLVNNQLSVKYFENWHWSLMLLRSV